MEKQNKQARHGYVEEDQFPISYESHKSGTYHIYLFGQITNPGQFIGAVEVMRNATENDEVVIHLQSCGGSLDATDTLLQAMQECEAHVTVNASGGCHSAASIILLAANSFKLSDNFSSLLHNGSVGSGGKFSDYRTETAFTAKWMEKVMRDTYQGFLEPDEIDNLLKGQDIWLDSEQWVERHNRRNEYIREKLEAFQATMAEEEDLTDVLAEVNAAIAKMEDGENPVAMPSPGRGRTSRKKA